jgi:NADH-quinone oxidoreductase subunit A
MLATYLPIAFMATFALAFAVGSIVLSYLFSVRRPNKAKRDPYECGMPSEGVGNLRIPVKYYLTALLFLVFDIETVFVLIWAIVFREFGTFALVEMAFFLGILVVGLAYAWKKGALEWK